MRKIEVVIEEKLMFQKSVTVETDLSDEEFEEYLDNSESLSHPDDIEALFENGGMNIVERFSNDYGNPMDYEVEVTEYFDVKENKDEKN